MEFSGHFDNIKNLIKNGDFLGTLCAIDAERMIIR
jgi:hypothetical protein